MRIGLGYVKGVGKSAEDIVAERDRGGPYADPGDLVRRAPVGRDSLAQLVRAGALDRFDSNRRRLLWEIRLHRAPERGQLALPLDAAPTPRLAGMSEWDRMVADHETMHLTTGPHPMALLRPSLPASIRTSLDLRTDRHGLRVTVAGMMIARQRPHTAKGIVFLLVEDEHGMTNVIVPPDDLRARPGGGARRAAGAGDRQAGEARGDDQRDRRARRGAGPPGPAGDRPARPEVDDAELRRLRAAAPAANSFARGRRWNGWRVWWRMGVCWVIGGAVVSAVCDYYELSSRKGDIGECSSSNRLPNDVTIAQTATTHASMTVTTVASAWSCMTPARPLRPYSFISMTPSKPVIDDRRRTQTSVEGHPPGAPARVNPYTRNA